MEVLAVFETTVVVLEREQERSPEQAGNSGDHTCTHQLELPPLTLLS